MRNILLVEDDFLIAYDLKAQLEEAGMAVLGPVASNDAAHALLGQGDVHAAILDMDLGGITSFPTAERLQARGIPFVFVSGNDQDELHGGLAGSPVHTKPVHFPRLVKQLEQMIGPS